MKNFKPGICWKIVLALILALSMSIGVVHAQTGKPNALQPEERPLRTL